MILSEEEVARQERLKLYAEQMYVLLVKLWDEGRGAIEIGELLDEIEEGKIWPKNI